MCPCLYVNMHALINAGLSFHDCHDVIPISRILNPAVIAVSPMARLDWWCSRIFDWWFSRGHVACETRSSCCVLCAEFRATMHFLGHTVICWDSFLVQTCAVICWRQSLSYPPHLRTRGFPLKYIVMFVLRSLHTFYQDACVYVYFTYLFVKRWWLNYILRRTKACPKSSMWIKCTKICTLIVPHSFFNAFVLVPIYVLVVN